MSTESNEAGNRRGRIFSTSHGDLAFGGRCLVMGVLNVTPDSFSDGGRFLDPAAAVARGREMVAEGADVIDVGGESTRPGSEPVSDDEQARRVLPVIRGMRETGVGIPVSIDTRSAVVAGAALDAGADIVNDVSGARHDAAMPGLLAGRGVGFVIMHMLGTPATMQCEPRYDDVVGEVRAFFDARAEALSAAGADVDGRMIIDPGIGFGKTTEHNLALLRSIGEFVGRRPVLVGTSRKRFIGELLGASVPDHRLMGTAATAAHCALAGVDMVRAHDVRAIRQVVDICARIRP